MPTTHKRTFRTLIERWQSPAHFAKAMEVNYQRAWRWYARDSVPSPYWSKFIDAAHDIGIRISPTDLIEISKAKRDSRDKEEDRVTFQ